MTKELTMEKTGLPVGWEMKTVGEVCEIFNGSTPLKSKREFWDDGEINWFTISDIRKQGRNIKYTQQKITSEGFNSTSITLLPKKSVLICCTASVGEYAITDVELTTNQQFNGLVVKEKNKLFSEYLFHYSSTLKEKLLSKSGKATIDFVSMTKVKKIPIPLPPLPQQKQIVAILDKAFAAIDTAKANAQQNLQNAKELFESYLQNVFENKGDDWEEKPIKDLTEIVTKGSSPKWQGVNYVDEGGIFFLTSKNVGEGELLLNNKKYLEEKFNEIQKTSILKKGDVLTNIVGASIGRTAIFNLDEITNINQAVCLMRCNSKQVYNYYLMYLLNSPFFKSILHDNEVDNARANLSLTFFKNLIIPLPKIAVQKEIVENIKSFLEETKKLESIYTQKLADLEEMKKSILQKAFSGQLSTIN